MAGRQQADRAGPARADHPRARAGPARADHPRARAGPARADHPRARAGPARAGPAHADHPRARGDPAHADQRPAWPLGLRACRLLALGGRSTGGMCARERYARPTRQRRRLFGGQSGWPHLADLGADRRQRGLRPSESQFHLLSEPQPHLAQPVPRPMCRLAPAGPPSACPATRQIPRTSP